MWTFGSIFHSLVDGWCFGGRGCLCWVRLPGVFWAQSLWKVLISTLNAHSDFSLGSWFGKKKKIIFNIWTSGCESCLISVPDTYWSGKVKQSTLPEFLDTIHNAAWQIWSSSNNYIKGFMLIPTTYINSRLLVLPLPNTDTVKRIKTHTINYFLSYLHIVSDTLAGYVGIFFLFINVKMELSCSASMLLSDSMKSGLFPPCFVPIKSGIFNQTSRHLQPCLWWQKLEVSTRTRSFPNLNQMGVFSLNLT